MGEPKPPAARARALVKVYGQASASVTALDNVSLDIQAGRFTAIMGPSGSGKSTLMHCLAGLDTPTSGQVFVGDTELTGLDDDRLTVLRRTELGFIFQAFNLVPTLSARENIVLPLTIAGRKADPAHFADLVTAFGLTERLDHRPGQLSGGQQQRVACARALITRPKVIFADEPTGNLDSRSSGQILRFLRSAVDEFGQTVVMVTHDPLAAAYADLVVFLADGVLLDRLEAPTAERVHARMLQFDHGAGAGAVSSAARTIRAF
ncbi:ABC transporter ATP-binding protein [Amycolatopsis coloradensis]|uniref:ABC transporter ATP-binding protein n=1 Tax=Amycolatopsis coloradensis TaxID=76021 RepID=A0ACD5BPC6_9PSEU